MASLKSNTYQLRELLYSRQDKSRFSNLDFSNPVNAIGSSASGIFSDLSQDFVEKSSGLVYGDINKVWRSKVLLDRLGGPATGRLAGLPRDTSSQYDINIPKNNPSINKSIHDSYYRTNNVPRLEIGSDGEIYESLPKDTPNKITWEVARSSKERSNIHNMATQHKRNEVIIFNLYSTDNGYQYIILQNRPTELEFQGETSWATIKSFGRNVPMYHFTGSEDKIQLQISWYCNDPERPWEVIQKCRLLEAWSKANGYVSGPPVLQIDWGGSGLFSNAYFILTSATYILKNFRDGYIDRRKIDPKWVDGKLYPTSATQELIFSRVSGDNLLHSNIYDQSKLSGIKGIGFTGKSMDRISGVNQLNDNSLWRV